MHSVGFSGIPDKPVSSPSWELDLGAEATGLEVKKFVKGQRTQLHRLHRLHHLSLPCSGAYYGLNQAENVLHIDAWKSFIFYFCSSETD